MTYPTVPGVQLYQLPPVPRKRGRRPRVHPSPGLTHRLPIGNVCWARGAGGGWQWQLQGSCCWPGQSGAQANGKWQAHEMDYGEPT